MKNGDRYSYATILIESHGFMVKTNHTYSFPIEISAMGNTFDLLGTSGPNTPNLYIQTRAVNKMVWDARTAPDGRNFVVVYEAGKSEEEVYKMIQPQLKDHLEKLATAYRILAINASEMVSALDITCPAEHICSPIK